MSFLDEIQKKLKQGQEFAKKGTEFAIRQAERSIKSESIKVDIAALKKDLDKKMIALAVKAYDLYEKNAIDDEEIIELCKNIKTLRWQIDEKWNEVEKIKKDFPETATEEKNDDEQVSEETTSENEETTQEDKNAE